MLPPLPGSPYPLGAHPVPDGMQFAVHAPDAEAVQVCLVDEFGLEERIDLPQLTYGTWHGIVPGVRIGQRYGYRAAGRWDPLRGFRLNPNKLLIDPAATRITGALGAAHALSSHAGDPFGEPSPVDSLGHVPLSVVTSAPASPPAGNRRGRRSRLETPWEETVLYELHVGSYTARHPQVPESLRGTYLGLAHPAVIDHLHRLGVTAVELLPVHACLTEPAVRARGLRNHWGYMSASFFAPEPRYASAPGLEVTEFCEMVATLHAAAIEVILDVVYNHTCEGGVDGPSISWRGLDARGYYLLDQTGRDIDITGCGNTLDAASPAVVQMVCQSLRYWTEQMGVDGFRFDLTSALGRGATRGEPGGGPFDSRAPLLSAIATDPVLSRCKLIAEPWDATGPGYQVGRFGVRWSEWNDKYRDTVRRFWAGGTGVQELASRIAGSEDIYAASGRRPWASVNFITAHDGFTAADLVSYRHKHNEANGEGNRDGTDHNHSVNYGVEGVTDDPAVQEARRRHVRALLATLILSNGTPMLLAGDELGHSQHGNNNAYTVPAESSAAGAWAIDWSRADSELIEFTSRVLQLRRGAPALRQSEFFEGRQAPLDSTPGRVAPLDSTPGRQAPLDPTPGRVAPPAGHPDLVWFTAQGREFDDGAWHDSTGQTLQAWVDGSDVRSFNRDGVALDDSSWLLILHAGGPTDITLGCPEWFTGTLELLFDSSELLDPAPPDPARSGARQALEGRTLEVAAGEFATTVSVSGPAVLALRART